MAADYHHEYQKPLTLKIRIQPRYWGAMGLLMKKKAFLTGKHLEKALVTIRHVRGAAEALGNTEIKIRYQKR